MNDRTRNLLGANEIHGKTNWLQLCVWPWQLLLLLLPLLMVLLLLQFSQCQSQKHSISEGKCIIFGSHVPIIKQRQACLACHCFKWFYCIQYQNLEQIKRNQVYFSPFVSDCHSIVPSQVIYTPAVGGEKIKWDIGNYTSRRL